MILSSLRVDDTMSTSLLACSFISVLCAQDRLPEALRCLSCHLQPRPRSPFSPAKAQACPLHHPTAVTASDHMRHLRLPAAPGVPWLWRQGCGGETPRPLGLYQGSLQEEYGCNALDLVGGQPAVPAAAAEAALGLRVQVELGAEDTVLPACLVLSQAGVVLRGEQRRPLTQCGCGSGWAPSVGPPPTQWSQRSLSGGPSPAAGRRGSPVRGSAARGPGSALVPSAGAGVSSRSFPPSSRPWAAPRAGCPRRTPSLRGQDTARGCPGATGSGAWMGLRHRTWEGQAKGAVRSLRSRSVWPQGKVWSPSIPQWPKPSSPSGR